MTEDLHVTIKDKKAYEYLKRKQAKEGKSWPSEFLTEALLEIMKTDPDAVEVTESELTGELKELQKAMGAIKTKQDIEAEKMQRQLTRATTKLTKAVQEGKNVLTVAVQAHRAGLTIKEIKKILPKELHKGLEETIRRKR